MTKRKDKTPELVSAQPDPVDVAAQQLLREEGLINRDRFEARRVSAFWNTLSHDGVDEASILGLFEIWWGIVEDDDDGWDEFEKIPPGEWTGEVEDN